MAKPAKNYRPDGVSTITAYLCVTGAAAAIDFYKKAFDAVETSRMAGPEGKIAHASLTIGDATIYLCDEMFNARSASTLGGSPVTMHMYVPDCDVTWKQAIGAGGREIMPLQDMFWGDRYGMLADPFGHRWAITTQKEELTSEEVMERSRAAMPNR